MKIDLSYEELIFIIDIKDIIAHIMECMVTFNNEYIYHGLPYLNKEIKFPCKISGYDIQSFIPEFQRMYDNFEGSAKLKSSDGSIELDFYIHNKGKGIIGIDVKLWSPSLNKDIKWEFGPNNRGIELIFTSMIEQSYLPSVILAFKNLLKESGVDTSKA